jgi:hypothetical protein
MARLVEDGRPVEAARSFVAVLASDEELAALSVAGLEEVWAGYAFAPTVQPHPSRTAHPLLRGSPQDGLTPTNDPCPRPGPCAGPDCGHGSRRGTLPPTDVRNAPCTTLVAALLPTRHNRTGPLGRYPPLPCPTITCRTPPQRPSDSGELHTRWLSNPLSQRGFAR